MDDTLLSQGVIKELRKANKKLRKTSDRISIGKFAN